MNHRLEQAMENGVSAMAVDKQLEAGLAQFEAALLLKDFSGARRLRQHVLNLMAQKLDTLEKKCHILRNYR